ncbi:MULTISPECIES: tyrosine-protein phosphatase [Flavobacterium]|uniref:protein-tyrosine-phosphatase n=2 Tax=Flavobacterium TaxID=237 RepID=A0AA94EZY5_9FLAO|nr:MULTISPECIES: CpsB/CapC family capsule biosynthesis tyrosine phosphatase [Flavobacterium]OXA83860.1 histidinol phosphatase [Flavobacterium columnare] [Flavobacterium columnare NBRC 100251 = ATCC 23463]AMA49825.1 histidinol phosphatase [Flavobacterium covae]AND64647.1 histidinol phosphatase [Flavobacterium covae]MCH4829033.1 histidinol phosphatase [Flavobacterium columnare]MCH4833807.1 histidinol phosphatase [Flavobacterium columnare]
MLFFTKSKPLLREFTENQFIDLHSHILPGIDDGAKNIEDTVRLITTLSDYGFTQFMATPHTFSGYYDNTYESIATNYHNTVNELNQKGLSFTMNFASEYLMDDYFVSLFKKKEIHTLKDQYVLVEMSYLNAPINLFDILFDLQVAGYTPILAHPERYLFYHQQFDSYKKLKNAGCKFQLNLLSTVGYYGKEVKNIADQLLKEDLIDFTGSDVHHEKHLKAFLSKIEIKNTDALKNAIRNNDYFKI